MVQLIARRATRARSPLLVRMSSARRALRASLWLQVVEAPVLHVLPTHTARCQVQLRVWTVRRASWRQARARCPARFAWRASTPRTATAQTRRPAPSVLLPVCRFRTACRARTVIAAASSSARSAALASSLLCPELDPAPLATVASTRLSSVQLCGKCGLFQLSENFALTRSLALVLCGPAMSVLPAPCQRQLAPRPARPATAATTRLTYVAREPRASIRLKRSPVLLCVVSLRIADWKVRVFLVRCWLRVCIPRVRDATFDTPQFTSFFGSLACLHLTSNYAL